ncbi:Fe-S-containing hydro-lyase [Slackia heliotrinireducens]|uniref:Fe-S-containing hydro-lyase n=1 Tax=Slackia heliotrinireducens TaxID=84110 RepID=UPI003314D3C9
MAEVKNITTPLTDEVIETLHCGDMINISGVIYTGRDAAHKIMTEKLDAGEELPVDFHGQIIYYAGPTPAKPGHVIGSCGPTTSGRMDAYTPQMIEEAGLKGMVGKGPRSAEVIESMVKNKVVYFASIGGAAAVIAASVKECDVVAYDDLGPEAVRRLVVEDYPCIVAIDAQGNNIYENGPAEFKIED